MDYNTPPEGQPGLWCQWICNYKDLENQESVDISAPQEMVLQWDQAEKFYDYEEWLEYLIKHFFEPWGYVLNGEIKWQGEYIYDRGLITVENNAMTSQGLE